MIVMSGGALSQKPFKIVSKTKRKPGQRANLSDETIAKALAILVAVKPGKVSLGALALRLGVTLNTVRVRFQNIERAIAWLIHKQIEAALPAVNYGETAQSHLYRLLIAAVQAVSERELRRWAGMLLTSEYGLPPRLCEEALRCIGSMGADDETRPICYRFIISELLHAIALPDASAHGINAIIITSSKRGIAGEFPRLHALAAQLESSPREAGRDLGETMATVVDDALKRIASALPEKQNA